MSTDMGFAENDRYASSVLENGRTADVSATGNSCSLDQRILSESQNPSDRREIGRISQLA